MPIQGTKKKKKEARHTALQARPAFLGATEYYDSYEHAVPIPIPVQQDGTNKFTILYAHHDGLRCPRAYMSSASNEGGPSFLSFFHVGLSACLVN